MKERLLGGLELWRLQPRPPIEAAPAGIAGPSTRGLSQDARHLASTDNTSALAALRLAREVLRASSETLTEAAELAMQGGLPDDEEVALCDILSTTASHVIKTAR